MVSTYIGKQECDEEDGKEVRRPTDLKEVDNDVYSDEIYEIFVFCVAFALGR